MEDRCLLRIRRMVSSLTGMPGTASGKDALAGACLDLVWTLAASKLRLIWSSGRGLDFSHGKAATCHGSGLAEGAWLAPPISD